MWQHSAPEYNARTSPINNPFSYLYTVQYTHNSGGGQAAPFFTLSMEALAMQIYIYMHYGYIHM